MKRSFDQHQPVCAASVASRHFIDDAATPPRLRRGIKRARHYISFAVAFALALIPSTSASQRPAATPPVASTASAHRALLDQYCVTCHNQRSKTAGLMLDTMNLAEAGKHAEVWEKAVRKLRGNLMPPPGTRQPDRASVDSFVSWLETSLDQAAATAPNPGSVTLHRLNRAEYANSIKELFEIDVDAAALLPADDVSDGFDNIANVLKVSPSFLDQYVSAARAVSRQVGVPDAFHPISHHQNDKTKIEKLVKIQTYHSQIMAKFVAKLAALPDGDGSMLDHAILLYGSNMSNSNAHNHYPLPSAIIGGANGKIKGGQHLKYPDQTPLSNLLLTVLNRAGLSIEKAGDDGTKIFSEV